MFKKAAPFYFRTISSLHCGSGNDLGIIDLPIQREKHTSFPKVESSSLKGALREAFENMSSSQFAEKFKLDFDPTAQKEYDMEKFKDEVGFRNEILSNKDIHINLAFGFDKDDLASYDKKLNDKIRNYFGDDTEFSGALGFSDARLLFFPVKSMKGVFAWITCPYVLNRFKEDIALCGNGLSFGPLMVNLGECLTITGNKVSEKGNVILEEYTFKEIAQEKENYEPLLNYLKEIPLLAEKLVILNDDDYKDFVNISTEVITRTKIDNATGTVAKGALFNEEYLPSETIMYYLVFASPIFQKDNNKKGIFKKNGKNEEELVFEFFEKGLPEVMQLGGNATIGKGIIKTKKLGGN